MKNATEPLRALLRTSVPMAATASGWLAARFLVHDAAAAMVIAGLTGMLTLVAAVLASAQMQETLRTWIRHRAEIKIAAAQASDIRRRSRARTWGPRWTRAGAAEIRQVAASADEQRVSLADIMRITRQPEKGPWAAIPVPVQRRPDDREDSGDIPGS